MKTRSFLSRVKKLFKGDNYSRLCTSKIQDYYSPCIFMKIFVQKCHFWQCTTFLTTHPDDGLNPTLQQSQMTGESLYQKSMAKKWIKKFVKTNSVQFLVATLKSSSGNGGGTVAALERKEALSTVGRELCRGVYCVALMTNFLCRRPN